MVIRLTHNPYRGINAHFNSFLLSDHQDGNWKTFHSQFISKITDYLNDILPTNYFAVSEQSLQIRLLAAPRSETTFPDILILRDPHTPLPMPSKTSNLAVFEPTLTLENTDLAEADEWNAVMIYEVGRREKTYPITRIEILSPSNTTSDLEGYLLMRQRTLSSKIALVEINLLHNYPNPLKQFFPDYSTGDPRAYPYYLALNQPILRRLDFYAFGVDDPIPIVPIPLAADDYLTFDWQQPYQEVLDKDRRVGRFIDYQELPLNFAAYQPTDQARISAVMERLQPEAEPPA